MLILLHLLWIGFCNYSASSHSNFPWDLSKERDDLIELLASLLVFSRLVRNPSVSAPKEDDMKGREKRGNWSPFLSFTWSLALLLPFWPKGTFECNWGLWYSHYVLQPTTRLLGHQLNSKPDDRRLYKTQDFCNTRQKAWYYCNSESTFDSPIGRSTNVLFV